TTGGSGVGRLRIDSYEITFWNEYMTLEINGERLATFPDLIMTLDVETGRPVVSAAVEKGKKLVIMTVPKENLLLGSTMRNSKLFKPIEKVVGKSIVKHLF